MASCVVAALGLLGSAPAAAVGERSAARAAGAGEAVEVVERIGGRPAVGCEMDGAIRFEGTRDSRGVVSGTWSFAATTECDQTFTRLSAQAWLQKVGSPRTYPANRRACALLAGEWCQAVESRGTHACSPCNGTWKGLTEHEVEFPGAMVVFESEDDACEVKDANTIRCRYATSPVRL